MVRFVGMGYVKSNLSQSIKAFNCECCGSIVLRRAGLRECCLCHDCQSVGVSVKIPWMGQRSGFYERN